VASQTGEAIALPYREYGSDQRLVENGQVSLLPCCASKVFFCGRAFTVKIKGVVPLATHGGGGGGGGSSCKPYSIISFFTGAGSSSSSH